jgi:hypothetical protein
VTAGFAEDPALDSAAEPVPDTGAFADARDRITWQNQAVREALAAERRRIRRLANSAGATYLTSCPHGNCPQHDHRLPFSAHPALTPQEETPS